MLRIEQTYTIKASPERVWAALTDAGLMAKWTGTQARFEARAGGTYTLWDDYVSGEIVTYEPPKKLVQTWQPNNWAIQDSTVTFTLSKVRGGTRVELLHQNVQPEDFNGTANGWDEFYIGAIKAMLEAENPKPKPKQVRKAARAKKAAAKAPRKKQAQAAKKKPQAAKKKPQATKKKPQAAKKTVKRVTKKKAKK